MQGSGRENSRGKIPTFLGILNEPFREAAQGVDLLMWDIPLKICGVLQEGRCGCGRRRTPQIGERKTRKTERNRKSFSKFRPLFGEQDWNFYMGKLG